MEKCHYLPAGIYADRLLLGNRSPIGDDVAGFYSHNLFYEIWYQWRAVMGTVFIILLLLATVVCLIYIKKGDFQLAVLFSTYISRLVLLTFSRSYLINEKSWFFIGLLLFILKERRRNAEKI